MSALFAFAWVAVGLALIAPVASASALLRNPTRTPAAFPFAPQVDPSADTMWNQSQVPTVFAESTWKSAMLTDLRQVEDLLDSLEAGRVKEREVHTLGNALFCVRWR